MNLLIIGATSDIAKATAREFAKNGFDLILSSRKIEALKEFKKDLEIRYEIEVDLKEFDIIEFSKHQEFFNEIKDKVDVVLVAAGYMSSQKEAEVNFDKTINTINVNYTGAVGVLNIIANEFEKRKKGTIIGISSVAGDRGRKSNYIYGSSKAAFSAYLSGIRNRLFKSNIQVITVKPGFVYTKMTEGLDLPEKLTATSEEIAQEIFKAFKKKKDVVYLKPIWRIIMRIIIYIPESIFKRMNI